MKPSARTRHWSQINEIGFAAGMRLLFWVFRVAGRWPFRIMLYPVLCFYILTEGRARSASQTYLRHVQAATGRPAGKLGWRMVMRHFAAFAEAILDKMLLWAGGLRIDDVVFHGKASMADAITAGRGGIIVGSHLGNMELCRVLSQQRKDLKLTVLVHTRHAVVFNRLLGDLNPGSQLNLLQVTDMNPAMAIMLAERIERGEFIAIAGDRVPVSANPRVQNAPFLGEPAPFPVGPWVLASLLHCPVWLLFGLKTERGYEVHYEQFREQIVLPRKTREAALQAVIGDYADRLAHYCELAPFQWFNFYDFWQMPEPVAPHVPD